MGSLQDTLHIATSGQQTFLPMWVPWIIIGVQAVAIGFLARRKRQHNQAFSEIDKKSISDKANPIDIDNIVESMYAAAPLYKKLSRQCHPDRFVNSSLAEKANELFQEVSRHRRNFSELQRLEKLVATELTREES
jgi:hypothetical protein